MKQRTRITLKADEHEGWEREVVTLISIEPNGVLLVEDAAGEILEVTKDQVESKP